MDNKSFCDDSFLEIMYDDTSPFDISVCMDPSNVYLGKPSKLVKDLFGLDDNKIID